MTEDILIDQKGEGDNRALHEPTFMGSARLGSVRPRLGSARLGPRAQKRGSARLSSRQARLGSDLFGLKRGSARLGSAQRRLGSARARHDPVVHAAFVQCWVVTCYK